MPEQSSAAALDWSLLRSFLYVAETGSLAAAARALGYGQPTLGRHLDALEEQLGLVLFERTRQGTFPTQAALSLLPTARAMRTEVDRLVRLAAGQSVALAGTVRITASRIVSTFLLPPILARLRLALPEVEIELVASDEVQNLTTRDADLALRMVPLRQPDLIARRVHDLPLGCFAAKSYLERRGVPSAADELVDHDLIGFDRNPAIVEGMRSLGFEASRRTFSVRTDDQLAYLSLVRAGTGIGFLSRYVAAGFPELCPVLEGLPLEPLPMWLVSHRELRSSLRIQRVADHLGAALSALDLGEGPFRSDGGD